MFNFIILNRQKIIVDTDIDEEFKEYMKINGIDENFHAPENVEKDFSVI